jgi:ankyrin repeat protein
MYAVTVGSEAMMRRLIDAGADVNAKNSFDANALLFCSGSLPRVKMLVEKGADVNIRSKQGHTAIFMAASHAGSLPTVEYLASKGAPLSLPPDARAQSPLAAAAQTNDIATVRFLLDKGGAGALAGPSGPMALITAASFGNLEMVKLLLAKGVDVNVVSPPELAGKVKNGPIAIGSLTPLLLAVANGDTETVRTLLAAGANVDAQDIRGMTPLMLAVATDHPNHDIVKMLLEKRPDMKIKSKAGETALDWALKFKRPTALSLVRGASQGVEPVWSEPAAPAAAKALNALATVQKSIGLLQTTGTSNFKEGGCISCHGGNIVTSAVSAVRRKGVKVDEDAAGEALKATRVQFTSQVEGMFERSDLPAVEILTFALSALADADAPPDRVIDAMVHNIAAQQLAAGHWVYKGVTRPPTADNLFTNAAFAIRAFQKYAPPARKREYEERVSRAARALAAAEPATTEDSVAQLLGLKWAGTDPARVQKAMKAVAALQRKDGGWAQTPFLASDAYATGTALHALYEAGMSPASQEYRKGVAFLLSTQAQDGSWLAVSRSPKFQPYFEGGFPYGHNQWISQWATGWATIALAHSLPDARAALDASRR